MAVSTKQEQESVEPAAIEPGHAGPVVTLDIGDPTFWAKAYGIYNELRDEGRVATVKFSTGLEDDEKPQNAREAFLNRESLFVTHYDDVVAALLEDRFSVDPMVNLTQEQRDAMPEREEDKAFRPLGRSLLSIDPPDHTRVRKLVQPSFTGRGMEAMRPSIQAVVDGLLDRAEEEAAARGEELGQRRMELISQFAYPFPVTVISDLLGVPKEDRAQIRGWTENLLRIDRGRDKAMQEEVRQGLLDFTNYLNELFERKRREPTDDMISRMVQAEEDNDVLTEDELLSTVFLMYLAGHVTTVNLVGSGMVALLTHPEQLAALQQDPSLAKNMVEETLRYWGPVDFIGRRYATEELEVAGTEIGKGQQVTVSLAAANHDPDRFTNPEAFDIRRPDANRHVAFGKGIHVCLGAPLARIEGQVAFETLVRRYPELRLAVPEDEIQWAPNFLRGFRQVPILY